MKSKVLQSLTDAEAYKLYTAAFRRPIDKSTYFKTLIPSQGDFPLRGPGIIVGDRNHQIEVYEQGHFLAKNTVGDCIEFNIYRLLDCLYDLDVDLKLLKAGA